MAGYAQYGVPTGSPALSGSPSTPGGIDWGKIASTWGPAVLTALGGGVGAYMQNKANNAQIGESQRQFDLSLGRTKEQDALEADKEKYRRSVDESNGPAKQAVLNALLGRLHVGGGQTPNPVMPQQAPGMGAQPLGSGLPGGGAVSQQQLMALLAGFGR